MAKYKLIKKHNYSQRPSTLLVYGVDPETQRRYRKINAAGLFPEEQVVELNGEQIGVRIEPEWVPNNEVVCIHAIARWLNEDGSTREDVRGRPIETSHSASFDHAIIERMGLDKLRDNVVALVLGQEQPQMKIDGIEQPIVNIAPEHKSSSNIQVAIDLVKNIKELKVKL